MAERRDGVAVHFTHAGGRVEEYVVHCLPAAPHIRKEVRGGAKEIERQREADSPVFAPARRDAGH